MAHGAVRDHGHLAYLPPALEDAPKDFFIFGVEFLPLAVSAVRQEARFETDEDSAFLICAAAELHTTSADAVLAGQPRALVNIKQLSSGQLLLRPTAPGQNDSPLDNWFGTGQNPMYWSVPVIIPPNDGMVVMLTNLEATARNYRLTFLGCKIFRVPAMDPYAYFRAGTW